jgi:hypothetical protein
MQPVRPVASSRGAPDGSLRLRGWRAPARCGRGTLPAATSASREGSQCGQRDPDRSIAARRKGPVEGRTQIVDFLRVIGQPFTRKSQSCARRLIHVGRSRNMCCRAPLGSSALDDQVGDTTSLTGSRFRFRSLRSEECRCATPTHRAYRDVMTNRARRGRRRNRQPVGISRMEIMRQTRPTCRKTGARTRARYPPPVPAPRPATPTQKARSV